MMIKWNEATAAAAVMRMAQIFDLPNLYIIKFIFNFVKKKI